MDSEYIQFVRYKLQKRLKRLNTADYQAFHYTLVPTWKFLEENEITKGILDDLHLRLPSAEQDAERILSGETLVGLSELESDAMAYWVVKKCAESKNAGIEI